MAIEPTSLVGAMDGFAVRGPEWSMADIRGLGGGTGARGPSERDFGGKLMDQVGELAKTQTEAADSARSPADGTATDVSQAELDVARARLAIQLAS